jgi:Holliday junction resolvase RusA-like endonuclease
MSFRLSALGPDAGFYISERIYGKHPERKREGSGNNEVKSFHENSIQKKAEVNIDSNQPMNTILRIKPISVNAAYQGRRFDTKAKKQFDRALALLLPKVRVDGEYYRVAYDFHLTNFGGTDQDNLVKVLQDGIVRRGIISDDRRIVEHQIRKFPSKTDWIAVGIMRAEKPAMVDHKV